MTEEYTIEDLENHSGIPTRTLHYYMQLGLYRGQISEVNMQVIRRSILTVLTLFLY